MFPGISVRIMASGWDAIGWERLLRGRCFVPSWGCPGGAEREPRPMDARTVPAPSWASLAGQAGGKGCSPSRDETQGADVRADAAAASGH